MKSKIAFILACLSLTAFSASAQEITPAEVNALLTPYFGIQQSLADDDFPAAKGAARGLANTVKGNEALAPLARHAQAIANAANIAESRTAFQSLSQALQPIVESTGTAGREVYVAYCPMAFGYTGAAWLQRDETIANPYFGDEMLRCGAIQKEIGSGNDTQ